jgi:hypothetical protein
VRVGLLSVVRGNNRAILREVYKPVMADAGDKGDRLVPQSDKNALQGQPDAQAARNAGVQDVKAAEAVRTNQSDGSLRKYAGRSSQEQSIEICYEDMVASRAHKATEKELLAQVPKELLKEQSRTLEALETAAKTDPVADIMLRFRKQADAMEPGPDKDRLTKLAKEQAAEILQPRQYEDQEDCGVHEIPRGLKEPLAGHVQYPEKEIEGLRRLTPEDLKKLAKAMEAVGPAAEESIRQTTQEILVRTGESSRDTMLAGINLVVGLLKYDHDLLFNPEQARKDASKAGEALGLLLLAGAQISVGISMTAEEARQSGDYSLPLTRTAQALNNWYDKQTPADQMAIASEICTGFGISAFSAEANKLKKPGAFMEFLKEGISVLPRNPEAERKALEALTGVLKGREPLKEVAGIGAVGKAGEVVEEAQEKGLGDHIMAMVRYFEHGKKKSVTGDYAADKAKVTKKELHLMTDEELAAHGLERIQKAYDLLFYDKYPHLRKLKSEMQVHHALPQDLLEEHTGLFKAREINDVRFLSAIPNDARIGGKRVHQLITNSWLEFLKQHPTPTREQVIAHMRKLDKQYGRYFVPPVGEGER